jgi:hypothetical protein
LIKKIDFTGKIIFREKKSQNLKILFSQKIVKIKKYFFANNAVNRHFLKESIYRSDENSNFVRFLQMQTVIQLGEFFKFLPVINCFFQKLILGLF